jgi:signal recognition particle GTPase
MLLISYKEIKRISLRFASAFGSLSCSILRYKIQDTRYKIQNKMNKQNTKAHKSHRLANLRRKLWKNEYQRMKSIAQSGNKRSTENHRRKSLVMREWVQNIIPKTITSDALKELIESLDYKFSDGRNKKTDSFIRRLKDRNLIRFDWQSGCYVNIIIEEGKGKVAE